MEVKEKKEMKDYFTELLTKQIREANYAEP